MQYSNKFSSILSKFIDVPCKFNFNLSKFQILENSYKVWFLIDTFCNSHKYIHFNIVYFLGKNHNFPSYHSMGLEIDLLFNDDVSSVSAVQFFKKLQDNSPLPLLEISLLGSKLHIRLLYEVHKISFFDFVSYINCII